VSVRLQITITLLPLRNEVEPRRLLGPHLIVVANIANRGVGALRWINGAAALRSIGAEQSGKRQDSWRATMPRAGAIRF
jgi:hypothetical protein